MAYDTVWQGGENGPEATRIRIVRPELKWWIAGLIVFGIVAAVAFAFLPWVVFGVFIYYVARPINRRVRARVRSGNLSAALSLLVMVVPIVLFLSVFLSIAVGQLATFMSSDAATRLLEQAPVGTGAIPDDPNELLREATTTLKDPSVQSVLTGAQTVVGVAASSVFMLFLSLLLAFFLLVEDQHLARWGKNRFSAMTRCPSIISRRPTRG